MKNNTTKIMAILISIIVALISGFGLLLSKTLLKSSFSNAPMSQIIPLINEIATRDDSQHHQTIVIKETDGELFWATMFDNRIASSLYRLNLPNECFDIALSPDGKTLAYTHYDRSQRRLRRFIELLDLSSGQIRRLTAIESDNSYGASWSNYGQYLAVKTFNTNGGFGEVGIIGIDNIDFRIVNPAKSMGSFGTVAWGSLDTLIYCGDLYKLRELELRGFVSIRSYILRNLVPDGMFSSSWDMDISQDGETLLFDTEVPDKEVSWHMGGRGAIYALDLTADSVLRVSPHDISARKPAWLNDDFFLFLGIHLNKKNRDIINRGGHPSSDLYLINLISKETLVLHEKVWEFSVSAPPHI